MKSLVIIISLAILCCVTMYNAYEDATNPAPDPFAKCVPLPSSDTANYWRCEK